MSDWAQWYDSFEAAVGEAGYDLKSDMPVFDFVSSEGDDAAAVDKAIYAMFMKGMSPEEAVVELEDRDRFWTTWATPSPQD